MLRPTLFDLVLIPIDLYLIYTYVLGNALWTGALMAFVIYLLTMLAIVYIHQDNSLGNFTWGGGAMVLTLYFFFGASQMLPRQILITTLILIWCLRLATHVYSRYRKGSDPRFAKWRQEYGPLALVLSFCWVVLRNGHIALFMALPGVLTNLSTQQPGGFTLLDIFGFGLWCIGFFFESVADYQLYVFLKNPGNKGSILTSGLWRYSRHPNYFGEIIMWWGIFFITLNVHGGWLIIGIPMAVSIMLALVSGVPMLEKVFAKHEEYQKYAKRTSVLIPWFPDENQA